MTAPGAAADAAPVKLAARDLAVRYGPVVALRPTTLAIRAGTIHAIIGPAGSGKTSFLRALNLLSVEVDGATLGGSLTLDGEELVGPDGGAALAGDALARLRRRVGIVFATPQPLPRSIYENLAFGPRLAGVRGKDALDALVERSLRAAQLWDEVRDRLALPATRLSGGQQQRLCLARTLALDPEVVLLDEPCSGLDPISTARIEDTLRALTPAVTCVLVTNTVAQARRVADTTAFFYLGQLLENAPTAALFGAPRDPYTRDYLAGRFG